MKKTNLTTRLNFKIVFVVLLLMITVTAYNHWLYVQEENNKNIALLMSITEFLVQKKPSGSFADIAAQHVSLQQPVQEQVLAINKELHPILNDIFVPMNMIKFGFYSRQYERIVAIGPQWDTSLLIGINPCKLQTIYAANTDQLLKNKNSVVWHGANTLAYIKPISENGVIIGHAFASINQDAVYSAIWKRTISTFLGAFLMLLVCVAVFRELFVKLKKDLQIFAESILDGRTCNYESEIEEFTPILKHISEQTEKMTKLDRLNIIGEMAAGIAHEIRNPMTTVRGFLQFLSIKKEFTKQKENFDLMIDELDRANSIITEFLSLAKNKTMEFSEINLNTIIHDIYPLLQADAMRNNCEIKVMLGDIPNVFVDQNSIRQLILNMVRNGLDAMPGSGIINIYTESVESKVLLSIQDCGGGIPPEIRDKLGTPFFTTKEQGTGLGLAICYQIVQRHSATLSIESSLGRGTTFTVGFRQS
ncbi:ATP-binding protein [Sporomusa sp.]|uniref:ATP-binding protein n=1 Tax=Sporomusa sp. TaxID=2078658 RepID=UPI002C5DA8A5|nr:ATP-binding protein [Sporomusa sp.]HWR08121.1 ATP-binding protein [Sporomusa sp.]